MEIFNAEILLINLADLQSVVLSQISFLIVALKAASARCRQHLNRSAHAAVAAVLSDQGGIKRGTKNSTECCSPWTIWFHLAPDWLWQKFCQTLQCTAAHHGAMARVQCCPLAPIGSLERSLPGLTDWQQKI